MNSASLCSLAGRYDNLIPIRCLAPIDFLKIPALISEGKRRISYEVMEPEFVSFYEAQESIPPGLLKSLKFGL